MKTSKKVLLLNPPGKGKYFRDNYCSPESKGGYYWQPTDLLVQSGILNEHFEVDVLDAIAENKTIDYVLEKIKHGNYFSILTLTGTASWAEDFALFEKIKQQNPEIILALSGNIALFEYKRVFEQLPCIDVILLDYTTPDYTNFLLNDTTNFYKIVYRNGNELVKFDRKPPNNYTYPLPLHHKFKRHLYSVPIAIRQPSTIIMGSAGCPYRCRFCVASEIKYRFRDIDNLIAELKAVYQMGYKEVGFNDFMFDARYDRTIEICQRIIDEKIKLTWACSCRVDALDEPLLKLMKQAGCHTIQVGIESASQIALDEQLKDTTVDKARQTIAVCKKVGIRVFGNFIIGLPGESEESLRNIGKFARQIGCTNAVFSTLVPDVGTDLRKQVIAQGVVTNEMTAFSSTDKFFPQPLNGMSTAKLESIRRKVMIDFYLHPKFIYNNFLKVKTGYELKRKLLYGLHVIKGV